MRRRAVTGMLLALAACREPSAAPVDAPIEVVGEVWAGGIVTLRSDAFADPAALPDVYLGDTRLGIVATDSFVVRVHLPPGSAARTVTLTARGANGRTIGLVDVTMHGWREQFAGAPIAGFGLFAGSSVMANGAHGLVLLNPTTGFASPVLPDSLHDPTCARSANLAVPPGVVVGLRRVPGAACRAFAWQLGGAQPVLLDSLPFALAMNYYGSPYLAVFLGGRRWLLNAFLRTNLVTAGQFTQLDSLVFPEDIVASPDGALLVPLNGRNAPGTPVYRVATGTVAYVITDATVTSAAFSAAGDTLWAAAVVKLSTGGVATRLLDIDPSNGLIRRWKDVEPVLAGRIAVELDRPWIYVTGFNIAGPLVLNVIDRRSMARVASFTAGGLNIWPGNPTTFFPVIDANGRRLYVVTVFRETTPSLPIRTRIDVLDLP